MRKFFHNLFFKNEESSNRLKDFFRSIKTTETEKPPTSAHIFHTTVPGGMTMEQWMNGEWSKFKRDEDEEKK